MKKIKICNISFLVLLSIMLLNGALFVRVKADTLVEVSEVSELSEEERYDSKFYQPIGQEAAPYSSRRANSVPPVGLENDLVSGLLDHRTEIDVSKYHLDIESFHTYFYQILNNHVELFFVKTSYRYTYYRGIGFVLKVIPEYSMDKNEAEQVLDAMESVVSEVIASIPNNMKEYEKALLVHDWLVAYCEYDYENYLNETIPDASHSVYGAFIHKTAVCDGYAKAYKYIMQNNLGIPCYLVSSSEMNHAWNLIIIEGQMYHVDATHDDPVRDCIGRVEHSNFLVSDDGITKTGHSGWDTVLGAAGNSNYEKALWSRSKSSVIYHSGCWYYVDKEEHKLYKTSNIAAGETTELYSFDIWRSSADKYWGNAYAYLQIYRNKLIFNGPKKIYSMPFATEEVTEIFLPEMMDDTEDTVYNIFGFKLDGSAMYYSIQPSPKLDEKQSKYIKSTTIPGKPLRGTVAIEGKRQCGSTLAANVVLEEGDPKEISYCWYRNKRRIAGRSERTYLLSEQDIGAVITVKIIHNDYVGELIKATEPILKLVPTRPVETLFLNGTYGEKLSTVTLPEGYKWQNPDTVMSVLGKKNYPVIYCPDSRIYEALNDIVVKVFVIPSKGAQLKVDKMTYKITKKGPKGGTVAFVRTSDKSKIIKVPADITKGDITYKVTSIDAKALQNKKITKVIVGKNVEKIGKNAFSGCKKLHTITIKSSKLKNVGRNAIKNIAKSAKILCPKKKVKAYRRLFNGKAGYEKTMSIKNK